jgi:hypothetical protein
MCRVVEKTFWKKEHMIIDVIGGVYYYDTFEEAKKTIDRYINPYEVNTIVHDIKTFDYE